MAETDNAIIEMKLGSLNVAQADIISQATNIANKLAKIINDKHLYVTIGKANHVYVEGWSTMGAMLGVLPREAETSRVEFEDGSIQATVELIRISDGAIIGRASAIVGMDEKDKWGKFTWANRPRYARYSMAITRATGKAYRMGFSWIMKLAGYAPTPAEEMEGLNEVVEGDYKEEPKKPEPEPIVVPTNPEPVKSLKDTWKSTKVSYEMASTVFEHNKDGSKGKLYIDLPNEALENKRFGLIKLQKKGGHTEEGNNTIQLKLETIDAIFQARAEAAK
jgi:hypothetical protein